MKKLLILILFALSALVLLPVRARALDRIAVEFSDGNLFLKEGSYSGPWHQLTSTVDIASMSLSGDRIAIVNNVLNKEVAIKDPSWDTAWEWVYYGDTPQSATKAVVSQLSNGTQRVLVLLADGSVIMKDGPYNAGWWSGMIEPGGVTDIVIGGDNIGIIKSNGDFKAKRLTPGQFSHPSNVSWQLVRTFVDEAAMTDTRIAVLSAGAVYAKEGGITAPWSNNGFFIISYALNVRIGGDRVCAIKNPDWSGDTYVECREGSFGSGPGSTAMLHADATDFKVSATRFLVLTSTPANHVQVLEGTLRSNSGWQTIATSAAAVELN